MINIFVQIKGSFKSLTNQYLGAKSKTSFSQGDFDTSAFTFSNGVFCDTTTKLCHVNKFLKMVIEVE